MRRVLLVLLLFAISCGSPTEPQQSLSEGWWVSPNGFGLFVQASSASIAGGCSYGHLPRPVPDRAGEFEVVGQFGGGAGPPPIAGYQLPAARFDGHVEGHVLTMIIHPTDRSALGPFTYRFQGSDSSGTAPPCP